MSRKWLPIFGVFMVLISLLNQAEAREYQPQDTTSRRQVLDSLRSAFARDSTHVKLMQDTLFGRKTPDSLRTNASDSLRNHTSDPLHIHTSDSLRIHASDSLRIHTSDPLHIHTSDSLRIPASDPLHVHASDSLRIPASDPLHVHASDSLRIPASDPLHIHSSDSLHIPAPDSLPLRVRVPSFVEVPLFSEARDSVIEDFTGGRKMMYYYGNVKVNYQNLEMKAEYMEYNVDTRTVFATGVPDTTGVMQGMPEMKEGRTNYVMKSVYYNFDTKKAMIYDMVTQEGEGYLHGNIIKKMPDNSFNISKGKYTTCDCEQPHFYLHLTSAKVVREPTQKTVFGPAWVVVEDVPTPLVLPFGFVPPRPERSGGLLMPTYGEEVSRGFFMRGLGYYFVLGDYLDFSVTADVYTLGSWGGQLNSRYKSIYKFDGNLQVITSNNITGERGAPDYSQSKDFSIKWSHNQDPKARPGTTFRASVDFSSPSNNRFNAQNINQARDNKASSSIAYSRTFAGTPFNLSFNLQHSQNMRDSSYAFTLPVFNFNMSTIYPFKQKERIGKEKVFEKISFGYGTTFDNKINFKASDFNTGDVWSKFKNGMTHRFSIGLPSFPLFKYLQFSPSISYNMNWHFRTQEKVFNRETNKVETHYTDPFSTFGVTQNVSGGVSVTTRLYGLFDFGEKGAIRAIRHMVSPSVNFSFSPNMETAMNGYTSLSYTDTTGKGFVVPYNVYNEVSTASALGGRKSASMSFTLGNNLEAKVRNRKDTTNDGIKKIKLVDNLALSGSYNFLADSLKLSNISVSMSTTIFEKVGISSSASLDPYAIHKNGSARISTFNIVQEGGFNLFRLTNASLSFSYQFSGKGAGGGSSANSYKRVYTHPITGEFIPEGWMYYMPPDLPWSVNFSYNYSYNVQYQFTNGSQLKVHNHIQTLGINSQMKLTKDFNMTLSTGVDLMKMKLSTTQYSATYDLHCFLISVNWVPGGKWSQWSFRIQAKAAALADLLKYDKKASFWDL